MITSFFSPKSTSGTKRPRNNSVPPPQDATRKDGDAKKRIVCNPYSATASSSSSSVDNEASPTASSSLSVATSSAGSSSKKALPEETLELISYINDNEDEGINNAAMVPTWKKSLEKQIVSGKFTSLAKFVAKERASKTVYPPPKLTFSALNLTPLHKVKVVIVGQDPYHQPSQGHGLSFSVPPKITVPPSLRNIYKELLNDGNVTEFTSIPRHGTLERWAKQGVLLLNNVLTVRRGEPASHAKRGWEDFTDGVIAAVVERELLLDDNNEDNEDENIDNAEKGTGVVFLLWGKPASVKAQTVLAKYSNTKRGKHAVICCSHPSPLGATKTKSPFMGSKCFSRANEELVKRGWKPIDWRVDGALE